MGTGALSRPLSLSQAQSNLVQSGSKLDFCKSGRTVFHLQFWMQVYLYLENLHCIYLLTYLSLKRYQKHKQIHPKLQMEKQTSCAHPCFKSPCFSPEAPTVPSSCVSFPRESECIRVCVLSIMMHYAYTPDPFFPTYAFSLVLFPISTHIASSFF